jgi:hypothetical protein
MEKELKKALKKIALELKETKQEVKIGTIDSVFLSLVVLSLSIILAINLSGLINLLSIFGIFKPYVIVLVLYSSVLIPFIFYSLFQYPLSIFFDKNRFSIKINVLSLLGGSFVFLGLLFILLFIFFIVEQILKISIHQLIPEISLVTILILTIFFYFKSILPEMKDYFLSNFPTLIFQKINKMNAKNRASALKSFNTSYPKLKKIAGYY